MKRAKVRQWRWDNEGNRLMETEVFRFKSSLGLGGSERVSECGASLWALVYAPAGVTGFRARSNFGTCK